MRGQISFEYLLIFCLSVSIFLSILPVLSKVKNSSDRVWVKSELERISGDISSACESVKVMGSGSSVVLKPEIPLEVRRENGGLSLDYKDVTVNTNWNGSCSIEERNESKYIIITSKN